MLKLLLSIPKDVIAFQIVPFLDLVSLAKLDSATMSNKHRSSVLTHVFVDITTSGVCRYSQDLIGWLMCRQVHVSGIKFCSDTIDVDLAIAAPAIANAKHLDLTNCYKVTNEGAQSLIASSFLLNTVYFTWCSWLTDCTLCKLADEHSNLTKLHLSGSRLITDSAIVHIANQCKNLSGVCLDGCELISDVSIQALSRCPLSYLSIMSCFTITEASVVQFIEKVGASLTNVNSNYHTAGIVLALTRHCPYLERMLLNGSNTSAATLDYIILHITQSLKEFRIWGCAALTDERLEQIASRAIHLNSLTITHLVQLTNNSLVCVGKNLPQLVKCELHGLMFGYEGFSALARGCRNIKYLDVSGCTLFCDDSLREIVQNCSKLSSLHICGTSVSSRGISYIADHCTNLTNISLDSTATTDEDVIHLVTSCDKLVRIGYLSEHNSKVTNQLRDMVLQRRESLKSDVCW